jgi:enoyl-CoA hydratase
MSAERAYTLGFTPIAPVEPGQLIETALHLAQTIARQGPDAVRSILSAVDVSLDGPIGTGLDYETSLAARAISSSESAEGVAAFLERRAPGFAPEPDSSPPPKAADSR